MLKGLMIFHLKRWANKFGNSNISTCENIPYNWGSNKSWFKTKHYTLCSVILKCRLLICIGFYLTQLTPGSNCWKNGFFFFLSHCLPSVLSWHQHWLMTVLECAVLSRVEAWTDLGVSWSPASARPGGWCHTTVSDVQNEQAVFPPGWLFDLEFSERKQQQLTVLHWQHSEEMRSRVTFKMINNRLRFIMQECDIDFLGKVP